MGVICLLCIDGGPRVRRRPTPPYHYVRSGAPRLGHRFVGAGMAIGDSLSGVRIRLTAMHLGDPLHVLQV
jgi:hypothetical protein